jgi:hypothetical protein
LRALPARWSRHSWRACFSSPFSSSPKPRARPGLGLKHLVDITMEMVQAFLLLDPQQLFGLVTRAPVGHHDSRVGGWNQFPYLFVARSPLPHCSTNETHAQTIRKPASTNSTFSSAPPCLRVKIPSRHPLRPCNANFRAPRTRHPAAHDHAPPSLYYYPHSKALSLFRWNPPALPPAIL